MIQEWFEKDYIIIALIGLCVIGLMLKLITNFVYIRLVKASANMSASKNKLVKQMKLKFETFYKLKIGVNNVDIFVDKYVYKYKICGLLLSTWENIGGLMLMLCLLTAPVFSILGLILECGETKILSTFFTGVCTSAILILVDNLFNISSKRQIIKLNIKDYLENYLKARLVQEAQNPEAFAGYRAELASSTEKQINPRIVKKETKRLEKEQKERQKILELEEKQKEREQKRQRKVELKESELARKEEEKRFFEEERRKEAEAKAAKKRKVIEEKKEKERQKILEKQQQAEAARQEAEERAAKKRQDNAKKIGEREVQAQELRAEELTVRHEANRQALGAIQLAKSVEASAIVKENKNKKNEKQTLIQQRNERLKEEIQAQREQRAKERQEGKDPFESYVGAKKAKSPKDYNGVGDFNMEYEMRGKAVQREEAKRREELSSQQTEKAEQVAAATMQLVKNPTITLKGNNPSEDKLIDDILKEFLA